MTLSDALTRPAAACRNHLRYRRTVGELEACSDHVLRDLGIYRGEIRRFARPGPR